LTTGELSITDGQLQLLKNAAEIITNKLNAEVPALCLKATKQLYKNIAKLEEYQHGFDTLHTHQDGEQVHLFSEDIQRI
jgi:soluble cytochrome b562